MTKIKKIYWSKIETHCLYYIFSHSVDPKGSGMRMFQWPPLPHPDTEKSFVERITAFRSELSKWIQANPIKFYLAQLGKFQLSYNNEYEDYLESESNKKNGLTYPMIIFAKRSSWYKENEIVSDCIIKINSEIQDTLDSQIEILGSISRKEPIVFISKEERYKDLGYVSKYLSKIHEIIKPLADYLMAQDGAVKIQDIISWKN